MIDPNTVPTSALWVYLSASPLTWLCATLLAYLLGAAISKRTKDHPLANPVAIAMCILVGLLLVSGTPYDTYFAGAQFIHFLLGPATVVLAVPLYQQRARLRANAWPLAVGLVAGSIAAAASAVLIGWAMGLGPETLRSLAPKSVTTPIAMGITEHLGGIPSLTVVMVMITGVFGAMIARPLHRAMGITHPIPRGFSMGMTSHGLGAARAFQESETMGAFAGLAIGLNGLFTALWVPWAMRAMGW